MMGSENKNWKDEYDHVLNCFKLSSVHNKDLTKRIARLERIVAAQQKQLDKVSQEKEKESRVNLKKALDDEKALSDTLATELEHVKKNALSYQVGCRILESENETLRDKNRTLSANLNTAILDNQVMGRDLQSIQGLVEFLQSKIK